eukprot:CAMPEP_0184989876 /NCGR_PEP_ID=MMETSP1098-20130426/30532_1 /TAXON_ID=89044 /ORGANISM="Spumella elongata, Strain CCAP 955/1" /LENGTH=1412 /DNA_ID=CAMNT_0027514969 /DNA_START=100 /DNA_END=4338 /DNA_ORIENTATION=+
MNKYPLYVTKEGRPQVFLTGQVETEPDIHDRLIRVLQSGYKDADSKDASAVIFKTVATEHALPEKKPSKDTISTEGIIKYNWPMKHFESVPSVLLFTVAFSVDWTLSEWVRKESWIQDRFNRLKALTTPRDIKIIVLVIKVGAGSTDKDAMDERLNSLKKHLNLDSRTFHLLTSADISSNSATTKKVAKYVKDYSSTYYINIVKHLKTLEKAVSEKYKGLDECILKARYNFKIAFFSEFQSQQQQSLRYYHQCYQALSMCADLASGDLLEQVKSVAEIVHFKICNIRLITNSITACFDQFKAHMKKFVSSKSSNLWRHYAWVTDQYVVFAELLQHFSVIETMDLPDSFTGYYYQNAARFAQKRLASFDKVRAKISASASSTRDNSLHARGSEPDHADTQARTSFRGMIVIAPRFVGSAIQFEEPLMDQLNVGNSLTTFSEYLQEKELKVKHGAIIMNLLNLALEKTNYAFVRQRGLLQFYIAEQLMSEKSYPRALDCLKIATEYLAEERWVLPLVNVLSLTTKCAMLLGRPLDFLDAALALYASAAQDYLSRYEVEALHLNILSLFEATLTTPLGGSPQLPDNVFAFARLPVRERASFLTTSIAPLINRADYGQAAATDANDNLLMPVAAYTLGSRHTIRMTADTKSMFDVSVAFDSKTVELGQSVLVTLTVRSKFIDEMVFDEMKIFFTDKVVVKTIVSTDRLSAEEQGKFPARVLPAASNRPAKGASLNHKDAGNEGRVSNEESIYTSLAFPPKKDVQFSFYVYISEPCFSKFVAPDAILCLERIELSLFAQEKLSKVQIPRTKSAARDSSEDDGHPSVVFDVSAFPAGVQRALQEVTLAAGKPHTLRDIVKFCANEKFGAVAVLKPTAQISLLEPIQTVNLLQGVVQRVNVFLKLGQSDVLDGYVYLSSDHQPQGSRDALFWYPDKPKLVEASTRLNAMQTQDEWTVDALLDGVPFYPIALNNLFQPSQPIHIPAPSNILPGAETVICVPLFVKCDTAKSLTISLRVEFVPRGILRSFLTKEFTISASFLTPFDAKFTLGRDGSSLDFDDAAVTTGQPALLSASLVCLNSLQNALGVVDLVLRTEIGNDSKFEIVGEAAGPTTSSVLLSSSRRPLPLRSQELFTKSVRVQQPSSSVDATKLPLPPQSPQQGHALYRKLAAETEKAPPKTATETVVCPGHLEVRWRILQAHILSSPFVALNTVAVDSPVRKASVYRRSEAAHASSEAPKEQVSLDWLLSLGRDPRDITGSRTPGAASLVSAAAPDVNHDLKYLDRDVRASSLCRVVFPVPDFKVSEAPFDVSIDFPSECSLQSLLEVVVSVRSLQNTPERVRVNVVVTDNFLLAGSTLTVLEVPARGCAKLNVSLVPVRSGSLALPGLIAVWDRGINNSVTLFESGQADPHAQHIFVHPV